MKLLHHEAEQLLDHLEHRPDIWSNTREGLWLRTDKDATALMGLAIIPPRDTHPFRLFTLRTVSLTWSATDCEQYITSLCEKWTDYGQRLRYARILEECGEPKDKAAKLAVILCCSDQTHISEVESNPLPSERDLWPDTAHTELTVRYNCRVSRAFAVVGGGWFSTRLEGGMLKVRAELRSDGRYGGAYSGLFEGHIRPIDGNTALAAVYLFGNDIRPASLTEEEVAVVQKRLEEIPDADLLDGKPPTRTPSDGANLIQRDLPQPVSRADVP